MNESETTCEVSRSELNASNPRLIDRFAKTLVFKRLNTLSHCRLELTDGSEQHLFGDAAADDLHASIRVTDPRFYGIVAFGGTVGAAESFMQGYWHCDDLTAVVRIFLRNRAAMEQLDAGGTLSTAPIRKLLHWINRNTRSGSRRNISAHYDLGNEFFELWLDPTMMYSSAIFDRPSMTLEDASLAKLDRICRKLELSADDHVMEIGTGWGGFALFAAQRYGCRVTTTTISDEQHAFASARVAEAGLADRVTLLREDYRDLSADFVGAFDKLVSIEMVEAVGHRYLDEYFQTCAQLLKPDGMMLLQSITIADNRYKSALKSVDFIQRYIFPGGFLPSVSALAQSVAQSTDMKIFHLEDIGPHYATTLQHWRETFFDRISQIRAMGYSEEFIRMWQYYFCYCEGGFIERATGDVQILLTKPLNRRPSVIPAIEG